MQKSTSDPEGLNPCQLMDYLKQLVVNKRTILNEIFIRRVISAIFFSLFNYWALKSYTKGKRGDGPYRDSFRFLTFFEDLHRNGFEYAIYSFFLYRVGADHYILNPTRVELNSKSWKGVQEDAEINYDVLETLLDLAYGILEYLEKY